MTTQSQSTTPLNDKLTQALDWLGKHWVLHPQSTYIVKKSRKHKTHPPFGSTVLREVNTKARRGGRI